MSGARSKLIPIAAGVVVLLLLLGLTLGLRTVIEFDPVHDQVRTTRYLLLRLPISTVTETLWPPQANAPTTPPDWHLMHEFRQSATGTAINHTQWGAIADRIMGWSKLGLPPDTQARLATRTNALVTSGRDTADLLVYTIRIDASLRHPPQTSQVPPTGDDIDAYFDTALSTPIDD